MKPLFLLLPLVLVACGAAKKPSTFGIQGMDDAQFEPVWGRSEIKELTHILDDGEVVKHAVYAKREGGGNGVLFATDRRILFVDKGMLYGLTVQDFPYEKISSLRYNTGLMRGKVFFSVEGYKVFFEQVENEDAKSFVESAKLLF